MPHVRQQIRDAAITALLAANTGAATRVFKLAKRDMLTVADLPCLVVSTGDEADIVREFANQMPPSRLSRPVDVQIEALAKTDDDADDLFAEVETALHATRAAATLGGLVPRGLWLKSVAPDADLLETRVHVLRGTWAGTYHTQSNAPTVAL